MFNITNTTLDWKEAVGSESPTKGATSLQRLVTTELEDISSCSRYVVSSSALALSYLCEIFLVVFEKNPICSH